MAVAGDVGGFVLLSSEGTVGSGDIASVDSPRRCCAGLLETGIDTLHSSTFCSSTLVWAWGDAGWFFSQICSCLCL